MFTDPYLVNAGITNPHALLTTGINNPDPLPIQKASVTFVDGVGIASKYVDPTLGVVGGGGLTAAEETQRASELAQATAPYPPAPMLFFPNILQNNVNGTYWWDDETGFLVDVGASDIPDKEMVTGLFRLNGGASFFYQYEYAELKLVLEGEFLLTDGTGQTITAKRGDLIKVPSPPLS